ncbi:4247_t:CDS:1, partial [Dentiscutata erythropus]
SQLSFSLNNLAKDPMNYVSIDQTPNMKYYKWCTTTTFILHLNIHQQSSVSVGKVIRIYSRHDK